MDPKAAYLEILNSFHFRSVRLPVYWNRVYQNGVYDFKEIDFLIKEARKRNLEVVLSFGYRNFRWPECYAPGDMDALPYDEFEKELLSFSRESLNHFANQGLVDYWQVENETYVFFANHCRFVWPQTLQKLVEQVRIHDQEERPIVFGSGGTEATFLPIYWGIFRQADILSLSFYPRTLSHYFSLPVEPFDWFPIAPRDVERERQFVTSHSRRYWISEFQADPWQEDPATMNVEIIQKNWEKLTAASSVERVFLWGVEWWLKEKVQGRPQIFERAQSLFNENFGIK